ncbi:hypothetical protein [Streptomyces sp. ALB3]
MEVSTRRAVGIRISRFDFDRHFAFQTDLVVEVLAGSGRHGILTVVRIR